MVTAHLWSKFLVLICIIICTQSCPAVLSLVLLCQVLSPQQLDTHWQASWVTRYRSHRRTVLPWKGSGRPAQVNKLICPTFKWLFLLLEGPPGEFSMQALWCNILISEPREQKKSEASRPRSCVEKREELGVGSAYFVNHAGVGRQMGRSAGMGWEGYK